MVEVYSQQPQQGASSQRENFLTNPSFSFLVRVPTHAAKRIRSLLSFTHSVNSSSMVSWSFMVFMVVVEVASGVTSPAIAGREDAGEDTPRLAPRLAVARSGDPAPW
jgi:hypothetical protein